MKFQTMHCRIGTWWPHAYFLECACCTAVYDSCDSFAISSANRHFASFDGTKTEIAFVDFSFTFAHSSSLWHHNKKEISRSVSELVSHNVERIWLRKI